MDEVQFESLLPADTATAAKQWDCILAAFHTHLQRENKSSNEISAALDGPLHTAERGNSTSLLLYLASKFMSNLEESLRMSSLDQIGKDKLSNFFVSLESAVMPVIIVMALRLHFYTRGRQGEDDREFANVLKLLSEPCAFGTSAKEEVKHRLLREMIRFHGYAVDFLESEGQKVLEDYKKEHGLGDQTKVQSGLVNDDHMCEGSSTLPQEFPADDRTFSESLQERTPETFATVGGQERLEDKHSEHRKRPRVVADRITTRSMKKSQRTMEKSVKESVDTALSKRRKLSRKTLDNDKASTSTSKRFKNEDTSSPSTQSEGKNAPEVLTSSKSEGKKGPIGGHKHKTENIKTKSADLHKRRTDIKFNHQNKTTQDVKCKNLSNNDSVKDSDLKNKTGHNGDKVLSSTTKRRSKQGKAKLISDQSGKKLKMNSGLKKDRRSSYKHLDSAEACDVSEKGKTKSNKRFFCQKCNEQFPSARPFKAHMKIHDCCCEFCGRSFPFKYYLREHLSTHTGWKPHHCDLCSSSFTRAFDLKMHKLRHNPDRVRNFKCDMCDAAFFRVYELERHKRTHSKERPYKCEECPAAFTDKYNLKNHRSVHSGDRAFTCEMCGKSYTQLANLKTHQRIHNNDRPFTCHACGKRFTRKYYLESHLRTHTGSRPFVCKICGDAFGNNSTLKRHSLRHSGKKPFRCDVCGKQFTWRSTYKSHMRLHSGNVHQNSVQQSGSVIVKSSQPTDVTINLQSNNQSINQSLPHMSSENANHKLDNSVVSVHPSVSVTSSLGVTQISGDDAQQQRERCMQTPQLVEDSPVHANLEVTSRLEADNNQSQQFKPATSHQNQKLPVRTFTSDNNQSEQFKQATSHQSPALPSTSTSDNTLNPELSRNVSRLSNPVRSFHHENSTSPLSQAQASPRLEELSKASHTLWNPVSPSQMHTSQYSFDGLSAVSYPNVLSTSLSSSITELPIRGVDSSPGVSYSNVGSVSHHSSNVTGLYNSSNVSYPNLTSVALHSSNAALQVTRMNSSSGVSYSNTPARSPGSSNEALQIRGVDRSFSVSHPKVTSTSLQSSSAGLQNTRTFSDLLPVTLTYSMRKPDAPSTEYSSSSSLTAPPIIINSADLNPNLALYQAMPVSAPGYLIESMEVQRGANVLAKYNYDEVACSPPPVSTKNISVPPTAQQSDHTGDSKYIPLGTVHHHAVPMDSSPRSAKM